MLPPSLRSPKETRLYPIALVVSGLCWMSALIYVILYAPCIAMALLGAPALALAYIRGNGVRVGPTQLPDVHRRVSAAAARLGLASAPQAWVMQSGGVLGSFATWVLGRHHVVLYADLLDAAHKPGPRTGPDELDFLVGREVGRIAANHLLLRLFFLPMKWVPWLGTAWERATDYTADRCGHAMTGSFDLSARGMALCATGGRMAGQVDAVRLSEQAAEVGGFWHSVVELNGRTPFLCRRVAALRDALEPGSCPPVPRAPFAWAFAPLFGWHGLLVAYLGLACCCGPAMSMLMAALETGR